MDECGHGDGRGGDRKSIDIENKLLVLEMNEK